MNTWNLRTEILAAAHRWHWVVASFLVGALLGGLVSLIWPSPYRAVQDIYVGLNAYRATRDLYIAEVAEQQFRNLDDYKNWQMAQLDALALSDAYLAATLTRLQSGETEWPQLDVPELRALLAVSWRNTGDWHFSAQADRPAQAAELVAVWGQVVTEKTAAAVDAARQMVVIDAQMQAVASQLAALQTHQILLTETQAALTAWRTVLEAAPPDQPVPPRMHWAVLSQITQAAGWNLSWPPILASAPPLGAAPADYLNWLLRVAAQIEMELAALPAQIAALAEEQAALSAAYAEAAAESRALSANLEVQVVKAEPPQVTRLRPTATLALIGGLLGLLAWGIFWLVQITRRTDG